MVEFLQKAPRKSFRVRSYEPRDHAAVVAIFVAAVRQYPDNVNGQVTPRWQQRIEKGVNVDFVDIQSQYFAPGGHFWVAVRDVGEDACEEVVGMVAITVDPVSGDGELVRMFVDPAYHRCGIGRLLVSKLEQWAANRGFKRLWLSTAYAQKFYESLGYTHFQTRKYYAMDIEVDYYEKLLA